MERSELEGRPHFFFRNEWHPTSSIKTSLEKLEEKEEERILQTEELKEMMAKQKDDMENEIGNYMKQYNCQYALQ